MTIYNLKAGDPATLAKMAPSAPSPSGDNGRLMHFAVNCSDDPNASLAEFKLNELAPVFQSYAWDDAVRLLAGCKVLKVPQLPAISDKPVTSDFPVLLFNGGLDPATAPTMGRGSRSPAQQPEHPVPRRRSWPGPGRLRDVHPAGVCQGPHGQGGHQLHPAQGDFCPDRRLGDQRGRQGENHHDAASPASSQRRDNGCSAPASSHSQRIRRARWEGGSESR